MARQRDIRTALRIAAGACALAGAISMTAAEPHSVITSGGAVVSVWEARASGQGEGSRPNTSAIAYSVIDVSGTRVGLIAPTADAAPDRDPRLTLDRGGAVVVWSRFDGERRKIAYARLGDAGWTDFHYLTFGDGDDVMPRLATSDTGSYMFWTTGRGRYWYAPVELGGGRLLAAPRSLQLGSLRRPGRTAVLGGTDVPINIDKKGGGDSPHSSGSISGPSDPSMQGGTDVPIVLGTRDVTGARHPHGRLWGVASSGDCHRVMLVVPDSSRQTLRVFSFTDGVTTELAQIPAPAAAPDGFADATAGAYLATSCR